MDGDKGPSSSDVANTSLRALSTLFSNANALQAGLIMQAAFDTAVSYIHDRKQFNVPVGTFQLMQGKVADMYTKLNSSRAYVYAVARACDNGRISRRVRLY